MGLYFAAIVAVMVAGITYLQAISKPLPQSGLTRAAIHGSGAAMILLFFALIIRGFLIGPWWQPLLAPILGGMAIAIIESGFPSRTKLQWIWFSATFSVVLTLLLGYFG